MSNEIPVFDPKIHKDLNSAIDAAKASSAFLNEPVTIYFNEVNLTVSAHSTNAVIGAQFFAEAARQREDRLNSPEYKAWTEQCRQHNIVDQERITSLVDALPDAIKAGEAAIVKWIGDFSEINDNVNLDFDKAAIAEALKSAGYKNNARVGGVEAEKNSTAMAEFLVGRAINHLESNMPIHPNVKNLAEKYQDLTGNSGRTDGNKWTDSIGERTGRQKG